MENYFNKNKDSTLSGSNDHPSGPLIWTTKEPYKRNTYDQKNKGSTQIEG